ncbi:peptidoglycan-binding protein [Streptomyces erythrochromogenes]|uniref:Peptidoglycan-binding protein n=1 Tax=Streptomyces erythrochromogenes TaxID=285574 RepID=A0ABZ1QKD7_9ACTN|nr:peptidoglycan-binding protein [Streptomyces erythrochromogenes]MCX5588703.1 peptidoglycan-binding protein [Streptomyces erythrochromogenes]
MSQHLDENGLAPDDALLVRPYVAPSGPSARAEAPAWPQTGPFAFPGPAHGPAHGAAHGSAFGPDAAVPAPEGVPTAAPAPAARGARASAGAGRRSRLPVAVAGLLALAAVGALVLLLTGPDPEPPRADPPADLSLPALPGRSPDAGTQSPGPAAPSARSAEPSATATGASDATTSPVTKPPATPSASAPRPSTAYVTLRMGDSGPEVRALQEMLYGQGFTYVSVTGVYDGQTKRGVGQLQRDRSIKGDPQGVYGPNTQAAMQ